MAPAVPDKSLQITNYKLQITNYLYIINCKLRLHYWYFNFM